MRASRDLVLTLMIAALMSAAAGAVPGYSPAAATAVPQVRTDARAAPSVQLALSEGPATSRGLYRARLAESGLKLSDDGHVMDMDMSSDVSMSGGSSHRKNPMVALLLSCVVPGWGEIYAGETARGRWFMASEAAVWVGYGAFTLQARMREDDYTEYAQIYAGVDESASSGYLADIADYIRSEGDASFNQAIRAEARSLYPDDLAAQQAYLADHGYFGDESWDWGATDRFYEYRHLRSAASESKRYAFYMTGLAVLNRALSAIDSAWMVRRHNAGLDAEPPARFSVVPLFEDGEVGGRATLEFSF